MNTVFEVHSERFSHMFSYWNEKRKIQTHNRGEFILEFKTNERYVNISPKVDRIKCMNIQIIDRLDRINTLSPRRLDQFIIQEYRAYL